MLHLTLAANFWLHDLWHPLSGRGYQWWSGAGSDISEIVLIGGAITLYRKHNCHVHGCWRLAWHPDPVHGHPVCKLHHPDDPADLNANHPNRRDGGESIGATTSNDW